MYRDIPRYIDGTLRNDKHSVRRVFWSTLGNELFGRIHDSYRIRSEGGTDDLGNSFKPLSPSTIASRPIGRGNLGGLGLTKKQTGTSFKDRKRGLLTPAENAKWKAIFSKVLTKLLLTQSEDTAKMVAAKIAWATLKNQGARTKKEEFSDRDVLIMRVTDTIYNSLAPGKAGARTYRPPANQVFEIEGTTVTMGTDVPYAHFHNNTRPVIPDNIQPWIDESIDIAANAVMEHMQTEVAK
jgi:hypothetical protein